MSFFFWLEGLAQPQPVRAIPFRHLVLQTIDIMRTLRTTPRKGVERDTPFIKYQLLQDIGSVLAFFGAERTHFFSDTSKRFRYFINPVLAISKQVDSVLRYATDTTLIAYINAQSVIVHELTHYLQGAYDEPLSYPTSEDQYADYLKLPSEQDAFCVSAYFFTRQFNPTKVSQTMSSSKTTTRKMNDLLNYHFNAIGYRVHWTNEPE